MLQIRTEINNEIKILDLYGNEDLKINVSFNEVQDITKKNSPYSQTFKVPGSKNNNDIFNHFYDTNSSPFDYSPLSKFNASIVNNGVTLYTGYLRLNSTTKTNGEVIYDVTFYSEIGDLISNIKDKYLSDLQLWVDSPFEYSISGYPSNLEYSYDIDYDPDLNPSLYNSTDPLKNGKVYFSILNRGYSYLEDSETGLQELNSLVIPRLNFQKPPATNNDPSYWNTFDTVTAYPQILERNVPRTYMTGSLRIKDLYESIFRENGYSIQSEFFDTAYFKKLYMPLTTSNDKLYPLQSQQVQFTFGSTGATTGTSIVYACQDTAIGPPPYAGQAYSGLSTQDFTVNERYFDNSNGDTVYLYLPGYYRWQLKFNAIVNSDSGTTTFTYAQQNSLTGAPSCENYFFVEDAVTITGQTAGDVLEEQIIELAAYLDPGTARRWWSFNLFGDGLTITKMDVSIVEGPVYIPAYTGDPYGSDTYVPNRELVKPDIKQIDFISSINKLFNLIIVPNIDDPKTIQVEPIIDWIGKGDTLDWTDRVDRNSPITVQPLTSIINGTLDYSYTSDDGTGNVEFKTQNDREFGQNIQTLNTDYRDKILKFDPIFSSQVDSTLNVLSPVKATIPNYFVSKTEDKDGTTFVQFNPYKSTPKLMFRQPPIPLRSYGRLSTFIAIDYDYTTTYSCNNRFTTYPFGASGLTHAVSWNKNDRYNTDEYPLNDYEDLYDVYYKDYILDLTDETNRLVGASIYLHPEEVRNLKFNEKIFLDGNYYRVNKIDNASLIEPSLANVELIKLTRDYQSHRVRYYDLINCTGGTDLHTSTDLNYGIYYLKNYNVEIDGTCYTVSAGTFNSGYTYQALNISDAFTNCSCNTSLDSVDFYDELKPLPTPSPTPGTCSSTCTEYEWQYTGSTQGQVLYTDCLSGSLRKIILEQDATFTACVCDDLPPDLSPDIVILNSTSCSPNPSPTPTPTSTPAPPTPSVTPSITPTPSPSYVPAMNSYEVVNCDDPGDVRCIGSNNTLVPGKVVHLAGLEGVCFEVVGPCETTQVGQEVRTFNSCEVCPR